MSTEGPRVLSIVPTEKPEDRELNETEKLVLTEYLSGPNADNGTKSYLKFHPDASYGTASTAASDLLKRPKAKQFLAELREKATAVVIAEMKPITDFLPEAVAVVVATARGTLRSRLSYEAAKYIVDRALGTPTSVSEVHVVDRARVLKAVHLFTKRLSEEQQRKRVTDGM